MGTDERISSLEKLNFPKNINNFRPSPSQYSISWKYVQLNFGDETDSKHHHYTAILRVFAIYISSNFSY
jgi:hypothetical protein